MAAKSKPAVEPMKRTVVITRIFNAPRTLVFKLWTDPGHLAQWWGPKGFTNPVCEVDARPGGAIRIVMRSPDGVDHPMAGVFREVVEPQRLVFTNMALDREGNTLLEGLTSVTFDEHGGKTKVTLETSAAGVAAQAAEMLKGMEEGWRQSLDRLDALVAAIAI
ncbi:MAG TPA: SRPBCC domain-containing protein [Candidatus Binataceae bacterium]